MNNAIRILMLVDFSDEYSRAFLRGISKYAEVHGPWSFCRMPPSFREKHGIEGVLKFAKEWRADGIIANLYDNDELKMVVESGICIIAQDFKERFEGIPNLTGNYFHTGELAAEYFLSKGYENFAFSGFSEYVWSRERSEGYIDRIQKEGYKVNLFNTKDNAEHEMWYYNDSPLSQWLKDLAKPLAVFTCDDNHAIQIVEACKINRIKVPDEVSVLGVDNDEMNCNLSNPPLSSIALDVENAGYKVGELMESMINKEHNFYEDIIVEPTTIISRQSTDVFAIKDIHVLKALRYISDNINEKIQVADVLDNVPLCRRSLEKRFTTIIGRSIYQEILYQKMERATFLLLATKLSVFDIAIQCGLDDDKNFSRLFQKMRNYTPLQYRKKFSRHN
jgi:LacI family transcriptional regulator